MLQHYERAATCRLRTEGETVAIEWTNFFTFLILCKAYSCCVFATEFLNIESTATCVCVTVFCVNIDMSV